MDGLKWVAHVSNSKISNTIFAVELQSGLAYNTFICQLADGAHT